MRVVFTREAEDHLAELYRYLAEHASHSIAERYTEGIIRECEGLEVFPNRGFRRDDIRPGLRMTHHRSKTSIAFTVTQDLVEIIGIFHGGQSYEGALSL